MECSLRPFRMEDADLLAAALNNRNVQDNLRDGLPYPYTKENAKEHITETLQANSHVTFSFAIISEEGLVGSIGAFRQCNIHCRTAEIGYYIAETFWGRGYATSAVGQMCQYLFEHTDMIRIFAEPFACNLASCRVLEKNGFQCEGILRQNAQKNGAVLDMKMYSVLKEEFLRKNM
ncbi:MAG: GNAT family protein [Christensenella sp.]|nr:GNAT family protein [Christensenella sp.]